MPELIKPDGGVLCYDVHGPRDGPPMILIEGLSAHLLGWREGFWRPIVEAGYRIVRFDNRDVGLSQKYPGEVYDIADMADDVHQLIEHLELAPVHVVGQSMGGIIAQQLVLEHPEEVASLTLLYTAASLRHLISTDRGIDTLQSTPRVHSRPEAIEAHIAQERVCASRNYSFDEEWKRELGGLMWDRCYDPDGVVRQARALTLHRVAVEDLSRIGVPTLIVHGTADRLISHLASVELHESIPASDLWLVEGMGHDLPRELWQELTARILGNAALAETSISTTA